MLMTRQKNIFLYLFTKLETYLINLIFLISIYKHYAINIADPSSMQDACHMNFIKDHALCGSVVEHQSTESEDISKILLMVCHKISFEFVNQQI